MKNFLFTILLSLFWSSYFSQIYLNPVWNAPTSASSYDGTLEVELLGYTGSVNYYIEVYTWSTLQTRSVDSSFIDSLSQNDLVSVVAFAGTDTLGIMINNLSGISGNPAVQVVINNGVNSITEVTCDGGIGASSSYDSLTNANNPQDIVLISSPWFSNQYNYTELGRSSGLDFQSLNLCPGLYTICIVSQGDATGQSTDRISFIVQPTVFSSNSPSFTVFTETDVNPVGLCQADAILHVNGNSGPYWYSVDNSVFSADSVFQGLCTGGHLLKVFDSQNDTLAMNFSIADSSNYYVSSNSSGLDSLYFDWTNCNFDYSTSVDSASILFVDSVGVDSISIEFEAWQNGVNTIWVDTFVVQYIPYGNNMYYINMYCPVKSGVSKVFRFEGAYNMERGPLGINETEITDVSLVFPNPVVGDYLSINTHYNKLTTIYLYNLAGELLRSEIYRGAIYVGDLPKGVYFIRLKGVNGQVSSKFVKE